jgi:hypothetical protein
MKPSDRWEQLGGDWFRLHAGAVFALIRWRPSLGYEWSIWKTEFLGTSVFAEGTADTLEQAQLAAEAWLRERAREIFEAVGP